MEELKRLSQNGFQEYSHRLYSRWQKCTAAQGKYYEGNVASITVIFYIFFRNKVIPGTF
jgi:hypothetical protein